MEGSNCVLILGVILAFVQGELGKTRDKTRGNSGNISGIRAAI